MNRFEYYAVKASLKLDDDLRKMQGGLRADLNRSKEWGRNCTCRLDRPGRRV